MTHPHVEATEAILLALYGVDARQNLCVLWYVSYALNLARLRPTCDTARCHTFQKYLQVQTWLKNKKDPVN